MVVVAAAKWRANIRRIGTWRSIEGATTDGEGEPTE